jgi:hypothetical protein
MFPDDYDSHLWLGICFWKSGMRDQAVRSWEAAKSMEEPGNDLASTYLRFSQQP